MKRLISWLLALTLICGLLPMSVFAAETDIEIGGDNADIETDFSALSPIDLTNDLVIEGDFSATVTVPAKTERFYQASRVAGMFMTINDGEAVACTGDNWTPYTWSIVNATDAEATYTIKVAFPVGHQMNPEVIEELAWSYFTVEQAAGDNDGYFYSYTAPADGTVTLYFTETPCPVYEAPTTDEGGNEVPAKWHADIAVTNNNTYANKSLQYDGVDNYGWELTVDVNAGDELIINTSYFADAEGNMYPAGTYTWCGNFQYPAGSQQNPTEIYVELDNAGAAEVTVTVPAGEHAYYVIYGANGTTLAVNGEGATEITMFNNAVDFDNTEGTEDATYVLSFSTPVGAYMNPEVIEDMNDYEDTGATVEGSPYYYIWTAPADGTVTLDVTDGANITVNNQNTYAQYVLAEVSYDDNMNFGGWTVADNLVIEVAEGDVLKIEVAGYSNDNAWDVPAVEYTLTGDFQAAEVAPEYNVVTSGYNVDMASELIASCKFLIPDELKADPNAVLKLEFVGNVTEIKIADYIAENGVDSKGRIQVKQPINSGYMNQYITITIVDGQGNAANFTDAYGDTHTGSYQFGVETYVKSLFTYGASDTMIDAVEALLTYGSYAQVYFKAKGVEGISDEPAYNILTQYGYEPVDISAFTTELLTQELTHAGTQFDGISIRGGTPYLESAIYMVVQFNATEITEANLGDYTYELNYMVGTEKITETLTPSWNASRGRIEFTIENIAAALFDCMYEITVTKTATGEKYTGGYSMICYFDACFDAYSSNPAQADFLNLLKAMYYYNQAANAHFGK